MTTEPSASAQTPASSAQPICTPPRGWVWFSSVDSIARGQISVLAVLEIPLAMALFWCISQVSPWPWFTVLGLMAAPMLLLRSPASIAEGVERLRNYIEKDEPSLSGAQKVGLFVLSLLVSGGVSYVLSHHWLLDLTGWALFLRSALVGWVLFAVAVAFAGAGAVVIVLFGLAAVSDGGSKYGKIADFFAKAAVYFYMAPGAALGFFIRATGIRVVATGRHVMAGLNYFAGNWRETVLVIDVCHPPALLPGAETVDKSFTLAGLWKQPDRSRYSTDERILDWLVKFFFSPLIYLPALI